MTYKKLSPRQALNKAFLKVKPIRENIETFKNNLIKLIDQINESESEEFHKNLVADFLKNTYYSPSHFINTKGRNDLVIHNGKDAKSSAGIILEAKKPTNKAEMLDVNNLNTKAFQELILYFLRERITGNNLEIRYLVATNIYEWFIFDATVFEQLFVQDKALVKQFIDFEAGRLSSTKTEFFYKQIAKPAIALLENEIEFTHFDIRDYDGFLRNSDEEGDRKLIALFKLFSPEHLLKLPFANDSNRLDKAFYNELLYIIGLTETKEGSKKLIGRKKEGDRVAGSLLENAINQLDSLDKISRIEKPEQFGNTEGERLFNVGLELVITWINRVLFLKLLEAQLIKYHKGDQFFAFLSLTKVQKYADLNRLFFDVLARKQSDRNASIKAIFANIPYLNSSLFEPTNIEQLTIFISNLRDENLPIFSSSVLKDSNGKRRLGNLNALEYLFKFLSAYDFSSEGSEEIQEENKTLINASVLGLIFEKINGYKDGSFFTPGFITMYMCRETIRRAVVQKFYEANGWNCQNIEQLYEKIIDKKAANTIINGLKICDPAVGSGHFLVSALNEIIAIKSELKILLDRSGKTLRDYQVEVVNDELVVIDDDGKLFEYNPKNKESQRIQETFFHEKQTIIENCLFGVDINPNSVKICRLRLWIELLKNAYYRVESNFTELETLPNIDINIKCGNSLISRFALDADLKQALNQKKHSIDIYRNAVQTYRDAESKEQKREMERLIKDIKGSFKTTLQGIDPNKTKLRILEGDLYNLEQPLLFDETKAAKKAREQKSAKLNNEIDKLRVEIEDIESGRLYENALEWRFEFPEVLNNEGGFVGFDIVIGNPPYGVQFKDVEKIFYKKEYPISSQGKIDSFKLFYEKAYQILKINYYQSFIAPNTFLYNVQSQELRNFLLEKTHLLIGIELRKNIFEDAPDVVTVINISKYTKPESNCKTLVKVAYPDYPYSSIEYGEWEINQNIPYCTFIDDSDKKINLRRNFKLDLIIKKINSVGNVIEEFFNLKQGTKPYGDKNKKSIELLSKKKIDQNWETAINGRNIAQYHLNFEDNYVKRCPELHTCLSENIINGEKIYFQRMRKISLFPRIVACYDNSNIHGLYTCSVIYYGNSNEIDLKYLLALLNSHLINIWYKNFDTDIEIKLVSVRQIPIPKIAKEEQKIFILLVDQILMAKKVDPNADTTTLEQEIDRLVYQLYKLTEEEIKIVEGETN